MKRKANRDIKKYKICLNCKGKKKILWLDAGDRPVVSPCWICKGTGKVIKTCKEHSK